MQRVVLVLFFFSIAFAGYSQSTTDPTLGNVNVVTPKTPESAGFEKFGKYDVSEFTGTANISIPLYNLSSGHLSVPITLSYHPTGIKVNEEASWVGLGWDLIAGGRITVETKGSVDFATGSVSGNAPSSTANEMQEVFTHLNGGGELGVATFATIDENPDAAYGDLGLDNLAGVQDMDEFGTGEPDIFRANFMGHSFTFYFDKITGAINFIGERTLFNIIPQFDGPHVNILGWEIVNNEGVQYYFNQTELSTNTNASNPVVPPTTVTAWLLTKIVHPDGDYIQLTYANYGYSVPAFTMVGNVTYLATSNVTPQPENNQFPVLQSPQYLIKIETPSTAVNFNLATRTDLYGPGSRELSSITITDKITGTIKKTVNFFYSYFQGTAATGSQTYLNSLDYYLPSPLDQSAYLSCNAQRLRLDSVDINLGTYEPPYRFTYNEGPNLPDKYSMDQDHWGFYNGETNGNGGGKFTGLIPTSGSFNVSAAENSIDPTVWSGGGATLGGSRDCDPNAMQVMTLLNIKYPTGGSTGFIYEPHQSTMAPTIPVTGGGLRIKTINNYSSSGALIGSKNYTYGEGKYMGTIQYVTTLTQLQSCMGTSNFQSTLNFTSMGARNDNDILIGYGYIKETESDPNGNVNGSLVKIFNISTPSSSYSYDGAGITTAVPYCPSAWQGTDACEIDPTLNAWAVTNNSDPIDVYLEPTKKGFAPTPSANMEGKLMQEQYFDNNNNLLKSVNYYYHLSNYSNQFYSVRAIQNRVGGFNLNCNTGPEDGINGNRPVIFFISPAKSYFTLKDSTVETDYSGTNSMRKITAYQYNAFYQPEYVTVYNSDSTQTIHYTRTAAEIKWPQADPPSGLIATQMYQMMSQHALDLPIEQTVIHRDAAGDSAVISSRFNVYNNTLPLQVYEMETSSPLAFRSQFTPWGWIVASGSISVAIDPRYTLYSAADYSSNNMIWTLHTLQGNKAFIWDEGYNLMMAQCSNADSANVAFSSFETAATGRWAYNQAAIASDNSAPTGSNAFVLSSANTISSPSISGATSYVVSYWSKTGSSYSVTGSTSVKQGKTINGWTYFEHTVTGVSGVTISGAGGIDEVRLYPSNAQMISYTYSPLIGITSECDVSNRITYYFYDAIGRLAYLKDQDGNIIKTYQYHYESLPGIQY